MLAQRLMILLIPKQTLIAFVWNLVIDYGGWCNPAVLAAHGAQWMAAKIALAILLPLVAVWTFSRHSE